MIINLNKDMINQDNLTWLLSYSLRSEMNFNTDTYWVYFEGFYSEYTILATLV